MEIIFLFLRYWGLCHNWDIHNAFVFNGRHGVKAYLQKLKGVLMWQLCNSLQNELLVSFLVLVWHVKEKLRSQLSRLFRLGVVYLGDVDN